MGVQVPTKQTGIGEGEGSPGLGQERSLGFL